MAGANRPDKGDSTGPVADNGSAPATACAGTNMDLDPSKRPGDDTDAGIGLEFAFEGVIFVELLGFMAPFRLPFGCPSGFEEVCDGG